MQPYNIIEIFIGEAARWQGEPLYSAIVGMVHDLKIAARCLVTKGIEGAYENGDIATSHIEVLSYNMPVRITIVAPVSESERILDNSRKNGDGWYRHGSAGGSQISQDAGVSHSKAYQGPGFDDQISPGGYLGDPVG